MYCDGLKSLMLLLSVSLRLLRAVWISLRVLPGTLPLNLIWPTASGNSMLSAFWASRNSGRCKGSGHWRFPPSFRMPILPPVPAGLTLILRRTSSSRSMRGPRRPWPCCLARWLYNELRASPDKISTIGGWRRDRFRAVSISLMRMSSGEGIIIRSSTHLIEEAATCIEGGLVGLLLHDAGLLNRYLILGVGIRYVGDTGQHAGVGVSIWDVGVAITGSARAAREAGEHGAIGIAGVEVGSTQGAYPRARDRSQVGTGHPCSPRKLIRQAKIGILRRHGST